MNSVITYGMIVGMSGALLAHFICIWIYGRIYIHEPNLLILTLETAFFIMVLGFGFGRFVASLRKPKKLIMEEQI